MSQIGELAIIPRTKGPNPEYQDGDIVVACNATRTRCVHTEHLVDHRKEVRSRGGILPTDCWCAELFDRIYQYKFIRLNATQIKRIDLSTLSEEIFGPPQIDVDLYLRRRKSFLVRGINGNMPKKPLFGDHNAEIWYGGSLSINMGILDLVWDRIEFDSSHRRNHIHFQRFPFSDLELKSFLVIPTSDFTNIVASNLTAPEHIVVRSSNIAQRKLLIQKRKNIVDYTNLSLGVSLDDIRDKSIKIDVRDIIVPFDLNITISSKPGLSQGEINRIERDAL